MKLTTTQFRNNFAIIFSKHILLLLTICFLASCSKDDDTPPTPQKFNYRIKEERDGNNVLEKSYEYNSRNQVVKELNSAGVVQILYLYNTAGFLTNKLSTNSTDYSYVLDANGRVLEELISTDNRKNKIVYVYDSSGKKIEEKYFKYTNNSFVELYITTFGYNSKNELGQELRSEYNTNENGVIRNYFEESIDYLYDERGNITQKTYRKAIVSGGSLLISLREESIFDNNKPDYYPNSTLSKNNLIEYKETKFNNVGAITTQVTFTFNYTYNESGYITKASNDVFGLIKIITLEKIN